MRLSGKDLAEKIGCARSTLSEATKKGYTLSEATKKGYTLSGPMKKGHTLSEAMKG
jgi:biotin operon repressor